ncbi:hypothetical protein FALBO_16085 [Fusarium albosuccineum]|uniref:Uncharacterized protein n=1 Tax=Fusarium albosuccineum TaxID=1237068 RepID=A0A8H4NVN2_9HYPO|nr:hypothetical protein FALBO_16085 [Fusarium albosuccineum]KAF4990541.1 hypothetical protein FDECE_14350 [Fusarium decemcellulare]
MRSRTTVSRRHADSAFQESHMTSNEDSDGISLGDTTGDSDAEDTEESGDDSIVVPDDFVEYFETLSSSSSEMLTEPSSPVRPRYRRMRRCRRCQSGSGIDTPPSTYFETLGSDEELLIGLDDPVSARLDNAIAALDRLRDSLQDIRMEIDLAEEKPLGY